MWVFPSFQYMALERPLFSLLKEPGWNKDSCLPQTENEEREKGCIQPVSQMSKCFSMEGLACQGLQSPEEVRGEQGFWLLAQWSNGRLCDHRQLVKSPCPLPGPTRKLDERRDLLRYQMLFLNGIFQGEVNGNNCAFTKSLMLSYQNIQKWYVSLTTISLNSLVCCHFKIFYDLGSVTLDSFFHSAVFFLRVLSRVQYRGRGRIYLWVS